MINPEDIIPGALVIYVYDGKNYLCEVTDFGYLEHGHTGRPDLTKFPVRFISNIYEWIKNSPILFTYTFRGIELTSPVLAKVSGSSFQGFDYLNGQLYFNQKIHEIQPIFLHQYQKIYFEHYGFPLPIAEWNLTDYVENIKFQPILADDGSYLEPLLERDINQ